MAKQNRDQGAGSPQQSGRDERVRGQDQSEPSREQRDREQVKGSETTRSQSERPQRQPGRLPLPD
jgi:hypothetical protein